MCLLVIIENGEARMHFEVNGIELYYKETGQGDPFVLLHGNGENHKIFRALEKLLSKKYRVYAIDSRDHGESTRVKGLDYETMMEDVAGFIRGKGIQDPMLFGFSDGGIIGLLLAIRHPGLISRLIVGGANTHPAEIKMIYTIGFRILHFFSRNQKHKMMLAQPDITKAELNSITVPTLVIAGSNDVVKGDHTAYIAENIPGSALVILEGETHSSYVREGKKLYDTIERFLDGDLKT